MCGRLACKSVARVVLAWHAHVRRARRLRNSEAELATCSRLQQAARALRTWRLAASAEGFHDAVLLVRSVTAWRQAVQHKHAQQQRVMLAAARLERSMCSRALQAWKELTITMGLKRAAFARKQRAVRSALAVGQRLRKGQQHRLLAAALDAWARVAAQGQRVAAHVRQWQLHRLQHAWGTWIALHATKQRLAAADAWHRQARLRAAFAAWTHAAAGARESAQEQWQQACGHRNIRLLRCTFADWWHAAELACARRARLQKLVRSALAVVEQRWCGVALANAFRHWQQRARQQRRALQAASAGAARRSRALLAAAFSVWAAYARAMQQQLDAMSPFAQPRSAAQDRTAHFELAMAAGAISAQNQASFGTSRLLSSRRTVLPAARMHSSSSSDGCRAGADSMGSSAASWDWSEYDDGDVQSPGCITPVLGRRAV